MKYTVTVLFLFLVAMFLPSLVSVHAQQKPEEVAQKGAEAWLALTDSGKYAESWDAGSSGFKTAITKETWVDKLQTVRTPLGAVPSRKLVSARYLKNPPSAPPGEYVLLAYDTNFEQLAAARETVSMTLDKDGKWRPAGYFIKPAAQ
jgi:Protein of unknown function (DUF4019)